MDFGDWLRWKRSLADMEAKELAQRARISSQYLCDIEYGRRAVSVELAYLLASALGASPDVAWLRAGHLPRDLDLGDVDDSALQRAADAFRATIQQEVVEP